MTVGGRDAIIDPLSLDTLDPLRDLFEDPTRIKIFHDAGYDLLCMKRDYGFDIQGIFDTMLACRFLGYRKFGLGAILEENYEFQTDKTLQRSDWSRRPLTDAQLYYARHDTHFLPDLAHRLEESLREMGRLEWALEDFDRIANHVDTLLERPTAHTQDGFWRIKGAKKLNPQELGYLQALFLLRDRIAEKLDRPAFKVFSNQLLMDLVKTPPMDMNSFSPRPGLKQLGVQRYGTRIVRAIRNAKPIYESAPKNMGRRRSGRFMDPQPRQVYENLRAVRRKVAEAIGVDPEVIAGNACLEDLARDPPTSVGSVAEHPGIKGWRAAILSEKFFRAVQ